MVSNTHEEKALSQFRQVSPRSILDKRTDLYILGVHKNNYLQVAYLKQLCISV